MVMSNERGASTVHKVAAFVTRCAGPERELLVFRHPLGGLQLPAGTVEEEEEISAAVMREVAEETGLDGVRLVRHLGSVPESPRPDGRIIARATPLYAEPRDGAATLPIPLAPGVSVPRAGRGLSCRLLREAGRDVVEAGYVRVGFDMFHLGGGEWEVVDTVRGWIPVEAIATGVQRHLFHLEATLPTPDRWLHDGDVPGCELQWKRLGGSVGLVRGHSDWLARVLPLLAAGTGQPEA